MLQTADFALCRRGGCPGTLGLGGHARQRLPRLRIEVSTRHGKKITVLHRVGMTDGQGAFTRPALWFQVDPRVLIYKATAAVTGARGDHRHGQAVAHANCLG